MPAAAGDHPPADAHDLSEIIPFLPDIQLLGTEACRDQAVPLKVGDELPPLLVAGPRGGWCFSCAGPCAQALPADLLRLASTRSAPSTFCLNFSALTQQGPLEMA